LGLSVDMLVVRPAVGFSWKRVYDEKLEGKKGPLGKDRFKSSRGGA